MKKALIIIDLIEDIIGENGLSNSSAPQAKERAIIEKTNQATQFARQHGIEVIWVKVGFADDYHDIPVGSPMFNHAKKIGALKLSGSGCVWNNQLIILPTDKQFIKKGVSVFVNNKLYDWLLSNHISEVYFGGVSSLMAIQSSARQAHDYGFYVTVLADLCAAATLQQHKESMQALQNMAVISCCSEWINTLSQ